MATVLFIFHRSLFMAVAVEPSRFYTRPNVRTPL